MSTEPSNLGYLNAEAQRRIFIIFRTYAVERSKPTPSDCAESLQSRSIGRGNSVIHHRTTRLVTRNELRYYKLKWVTPIFFLSLCPSTFASPDEALRFRVPIRCYLTGLAQLAFLFTFRVRVFRPTISPTEPLGSVSNPPSTRKLQGCSVKRQVPRQQPRNRQHSSV